MKTLDQWCLSCRASHPHERADGAVVCGGCGQVTPVPEALLDLAFTDAPPVVEMADCRWCNATRPVGHDCPAGAVGCTTRQPDETPYGICDRCKQVQGLDLALKADARRYGSPSDLYTP